jgi:hypothetical protein
MEGRFDGEWVLIADPELDDMQEVVRGKVVYHGTDRDELHRTARELQLKRSASIYLGRPPQDLVYVL